MDTDCFAYSLGYRAYERRVSYDLTSQGVGHEQFFECLFVNSTKKSNCNYVTDESERQDSNCKSNLGKISQTAYCNNPIDYIVVRPG